MQSYKAPQGTIFIGGGVASAQSRELPEHGLRPDRGAQTQPCQVTQPLVHLCVLVSERKRGKESSLCGDAVIVADVALGKEFIPKTYLKK